MCRWYPVVPKHMRRSSKSLGPTTSEVINIDVKDLHESFTCTGGFCGTLHFSPDFSVHPRKYRSGSSLFGMKMGLGKSVLSQ